MTDRYKIIEEMAQYYSRSTSHLGGKPPREAYFYFPKIDDYLVFNEKEPLELNRWIYEASMESTYNSYELEYYRQIHIEIEKYNEKRIKKGKTTLIIPSWMNQYDIYRFLRSNKYEYKKTIEHLVDHTIWRQSIRDLPLTSSVLELLNSGGIYTYGRDHKYRPIVVMNVEIFVNLNGNYKDEEFEIAAYKFTDYLIENLLIPGQVENWIFIVYMGNASLFSLPESIKKLAKVFQANYRGRLFRSYILGLSTFMTFLWQIIKLILDKVTVQKFFVLKDDEWGITNDLVNPSQLERRFGGTAPNLNYKLLFPPPCPAGNQFLLNTDNKDELLVSEDEYIKMVINDKRIYESPFMKTQIKNYRGMI